MSVDSRTSTFRRGPSAATTRGTRSVAISTYAMAKTATVSAASPGSGIPAGTVTFRDGSTSLGSTSLNGSGVYGLSESSRAGVTGQSTAGNGVRGYSSNSTGVYGSTGGNTDSDNGVYGTGGNGTYAVFGEKTGTGSGVGVYGENKGSGAGVSGSSQDGTGTWGYSVNSNGVHGATGRVPRRATAGASRRPLFPWTWTNSSRPS